MQLKEHEKSFETKLETSETTRLAAENGRPAMVRTRDTYTTGGLSADDKALIVEGLRSGRSLAAILRTYPHLPGASTVSKARQQDAAFDSDFLQARADGIAANLDEALDYQHAVRGNKALSIAASKYTDAVIKTAPLMSPRHYGAMLRLAGADGEKLQIALVSYQQPQQSQQLIEGQFKAVESAHQVDKVSATPADDD